MTISFILTTLMCDSGAILLGEIRNSSPFGLKGLTCQHYELVDGWHLQKLNVGFSKWCQEGFILKQKFTFFPKRPKKFRCSLLGNLNWHE